MEELPEYSVLFFDAIYQDAKVLFDKLDTRLHPKCLIISISEKDNNDLPFGKIQFDRETVTTDPLEHGYSSDFFEKIKVLENQFELNNETNMIQMYPLYPELRIKYKMGIRSTSLLTAIETVINQEEANNDLISFCSHSVLVDGYLTFAVVQLNRNIFNSYYKLKRNNFPLKKIGVNSYSISASLIGRVVNRFLRKCTNYFTNTELLYRSITSLFSYNPGNESEMDEVIISAGQHLMYSIAKSIITDANVSLLDRRDLFYAFNEISSLKYEGIEGEGRISISNLPHPNIKQIVSLTKPIQIDDFNAVRKLLEITSDEMFLICDSKYIHGFGELVDKYDEENEDLFFIHFVKHYTWELIHADNNLMTVSYGQPKLPKLQVDQSTFKSLVKNLFHDIQKENIKQLWNLIIRATKQTHGTMVVISSQAEQEALRLQSQAIPILPLNITVEMMDKMTAIDGAVLINPFDLKCYAIGVILDGMATDKGNFARGARYNSAVRYCECRKGTCIAVVVSEDGSIDLIS